MPIPRHYPGDYDLQAANEPQPEQPPEPECRELTEDEIYDILAATTPEEWAALDAKLRAFEKAHLDELPTATEKERWRETIWRIGGIPPE